MVTKEELLKKLGEIYYKLSLLFEKSKKNFCGSCRSCCTYVLTHGVCDIEYTYIDLYLAGYYRWEEGKKFRDYINKKRDLHGQLIYTGCPLYNDRGCSIYPVRPYSCRTYGLYGRVPVPPFCSFLNFTIIYPSGDFYNIVPLSEEFFEIKSLYDILITENPEEKAEKYYNFAIHLYYRGLTDRAEILLGHALEADPSHSQAYYQLALLYYNKGNMIKAVEFTEKSLLYAPCNLTVKLKLGLFLTKMNEYSRAKKIFLQILEEEPSNKMALLALGNIFFISRNIKEARKYCNRVLELDPSLEMASFILRETESVDGE